MPKTTLNPRNAIDGAFRARFLKPWHLHDQGMTQIMQEITGYSMEEVRPRAGKTQKLALHFANLHPPYLVSAKADIETLKRSYGVRTYGDLDGLHITVQIVQNDRHGEILRIAPKADTSQR